METFAPGNRVVAINTDMSRAICGPSHPELRPFHFPNGPLRGDVVYYVSAVCASRDGAQGLHLVGMSVFWGTREMPWNYRRFRKVDALRDHAPKKRRKKQPASRELSTCGPVSRP